MHRFNTFKDSLEKIESHAVHNSSFEYGVNSFSDMSDEEFLERYENKALKEEMSQHPFVQRSRRNDFMK